MKKIAIALFTFLIGPFLFAAENPDLPPGTIRETTVEKVLFVEKKTYLSGLVGRDEKLRDSIGIETLAGIVAPIITEGSQAPASTKIKLGIIENCDCAKVKLFRVSSRAGAKPDEISYDAIRGFSDGSKSIELFLEVTPDSKLHYKVETPDTLAPGNFLEWMPANEIKLKPKKTVEEKKSEKKVEAKVEEKKEEVKEEIKMDDVTAEQTPAKVQ